MAFSEETIQKVWEKGKVVPNYDKKVWRKDHCNAWIKRSLYGKSRTPLSYGWEIDHINPKGGDELSNLQPLQWENNRGKGDDYPNWDCTVTSSKNKNVYV